MHIINIYRHAKQCSELFCYRYCRSWLLYKLVWLRYCTTCNYISWH